MNSSYKKYLNLLIIIFLSGYIALQKIEHSKSQVEILKRELHQKVLVNHELSKQISILNNCNKRIYAKLENFINDPISKFEADSTIVSNRSQEKDYTLKNRIKVKKISYKINDNKEKIAIIAAHGTLSNWNMFGLSNTASSMAIRQFAEEIAQIYQKNVDLLVLNWGGELQQKKRIKVGEEVAIFLKDKYKNAEIWGIAHSHGCNIINNTAEKLRDYNLTIKRAILIAPIAVDINPYPLPYNIEEYFNFYSCGDLTQAAGSSQNGEPNSKFFISYPESKSYCLEVYAENEDIDHLTIKIAVLEQLTEILKTIKKDFSLATDLKLVLFKKNYQPLITISDDNKNCDYNKYINKFFYLEDFEKILEKQTETSLKNKEKLSEIFKQPLFKERSSTQRFFHELSAAINQVPRHPWRNK